jgi:thiosulfate reductase/polysulfide reductase chain A
MAMKEDTVTKKTSCGFCHWQCGVRVYMRDGKPIKIEGDCENPIGRGMTCVKNSAALEFHNHPDRLNYPLKRAGERGEGKWRRVSWKEALNEIADKLQQIKQEYGPEAVLFLGGMPHEPGDWAAWRWCNLFGSPNVFNQGKNCGEAEVLAECATYGWHTSKAPKPGVTKCAIIWGKNWPESDHAAWKTTLEAKEMGCKLIVIDPRRTLSALKADLWLQIRPGTDGALALGLINVIIDEELYDKKFVEKWCSGFDAISDVVKDFSPERVEKITWVPKDKVIEAAEMYATLKPSVISGGVALCHMGGGAVKSAVQGKVILRALTGNLDVEGGNIIGQPFQTLNWFGNVLWDKLLEHPERTRDTVSAERFPIASVKGYRLFREAMQKLHPEGYSAAMYMLVNSSVCIWDAVLKEEPYPIKAIITQGTNPLLTLGNAHTIYSALKSENLQLHLGMDFFMTPTLELADYVFPATDWLERPNLLLEWGNIDYYVAGERAVEPLYERRDDYQLWRELGNRLGQEGYWPSTLEGMFDKFLEPSGLSFRQLLKRKEHWNFPTVKYRKYEKEGFATFSGKVELLPSLFRKIGIDPLPRYEEPPRSPVSQPQLVREFPLILITGSRLIQYTHSTLRNLKTLRKTYPEPLVQIHPDTAGKLGIVDGDWVYIETPEGKIKQRAQLDKEIHPKVVHADGFWWYPEDPGEEPYLFGLWKSNINAITPDGPEFFDYAGDNAFRALMCKVYKADLLD